MTLTFASEKMPRFGPLLLAVFVASCSPQKPEIEVPRFDAREALFEMLNPDYEGWMGGFRETQIEDLPIVEINDDTHVDFWNGIPSTENIFFIDEAAKRWGIRRSFFGNSGGFAYYYQGEFVLNDRIWSAKQTNGMRVASWTRR